MNQYNNAQMRKWVTAFFENEEDFVFFCEDQFPDVHAQFTDGMSLNKKARLLTKYCEDNQLYDQLISLIKDEDPDRFEKMLAPAPLAKTTDTQTANYAEQPPAKSVSSDPSTSSDDGEPDDAPEGTQVFISYSRRDEEFIKNLYQALTSRGITAWYDREDIGIGEQWAAEIVKGIQDCDVFLLSLSPDSAASENVRKEVDLAQSYQKQIVPLIWRPTDIPIAMEYQLAGIQWIEFNKAATEEKFDQLADVLRRLIGGSTMTEATSGKEIATESAVPAIDSQQETARSEEFVLVELESKQVVNPMVLGGSVIASVVTRFGLKAQSQDTVNTELKWLFSAVDNFLNHRGEKIKANIPPTAKAQSTTNKLLNTVDEFYLGLWESQFESQMKRIQTHLRNLDILLQQEAEGRDDLRIKNDIRKERMNIVEVMQDMAKTINEAYGILVTSPDQLLQWLKQK